MDVQRAAEVREGDMLGVRQLGDREHGVALRPAVAEQVRACRGTTTVRSLAADAVDSVEAVRTVEERVVLLHEPEQLAHLAAIHVTESFSRPYLGL